MVLAVLVAGLLAASGAELFAQDRDELWDRAAELVQFREYAEAIPLLEVLIEREPANLRATRLLATVYEISDRAEEAKRLLRNALEDPRMSADARGRIAFDLAVLLARSEQRAEAVEMYNASLDHDAALIPVYLNRANLYVELGEYQEAVRDYERFLALQPRTPQRESIEEMIALLTRSIEEEEARRAEEERRRLQEEEAERIAEEARREREERERREAEERRQKMMDSVMESLGTARRDARGAQADREGILGFDDDLELRD